MTRTLLRAWTTACLCGCWASCLASRPGITPAPDSADDDAPGEDGADMQTHDGPSDAGDEVVGGGHQLDVLWVLSGSCGHLVSAAHAIPSFISRLDGGGIDDIRSAAVFGSWCGSDGKANLGAFVTRMRP